MTGICDPDKYTFKKQLPEEIECDPDKLKQVFINIISNGMEAMRSGGTISISTEIVPKGSDIQFQIHHISLLKSHGVKEL